MAKFLLNVLILCIFVPILIAGADDESVQEINEPESNQETLEYQRGSLCGYCDYCKFCKLCDDDCPCEVSPTKPNCHMCKYCKYCYLCKVCDTVCQPGGIIDKATSAIVSAVLPSVNTNEVDNDIKGVKNWGDEHKDEL